MSVLLNITVYYFIEHFRKLLGFATNRFPGTNHTLKPQGESRQADIRIDPFKVALRLVGIHTERVPHILQIFRR
ncbi:hypothetical protein D3C84_1180460 [compost metagenome]